MSTRIILAAVLAAVLALPASAGASETDFSNPAFAQTAGTGTMPVGHAQFCMAHRDECSPNRRVVAAAELTEARWTELVAVNNQMNTTIIPVTDQELYQVAEHWTYPEGFGDCEDIALAKRRALLAMGWDPSTLLMTVVREYNGNGHAVLMVRTDRGDLVLDNKDGMIRIWSDTPYQYLKRQSQANSGEWVDITDTRTIVVAAN